MEIKECIITVGGRTRVKKEEAKYIAGMLDQYLEDGVPFSLKICGASKGSSYLTTLLNEINVKCTEAWIESEEVIAGTYVKEGAGYGGVAGGGAGMAGGIAKAIGASKLITAAKTATIATKFISLAKLAATIAVPHAAGTVLVITLVGAAMGAGVGASVGGMIKKKDMQVSITFPEPDATEITVKEIDLCDDFVHV